MLICFLSIFMLTGCYNIRGVESKAYAIALGIDYITDNKHSHVTVTIHPNAKPVESNDIINWIPTDGDFYITGTFKKITK